MPGRKKSKMMARGGGMKKSKGMAKGGAMKKSKGMARGGAMKKSKGMARGGAMKMSKGMARGGAMKMSKGMARGGAMKRSKGMARGGAMKRMRMGGPVPASPMMPPIQRRIVPRLPVGKMSPGGSLMMQKGGRVAKQERSAIKVGNIPKAVATALVAASPAGQVIRKIGAGVSAGRAIRKAIKKSRGRKRQERGAPGKGIVGRRR